MLSGELGATPLARTLDYEGRVTYWPDNLMNRYIKPVAKANGITRTSAGHTFRHSFGTLLKANGEDAKTVQELLRHVKSRITLDVYTQAVGSNKRAAQSKVVRIMIPGVGQVDQKAGEMDPQELKLELNGLLLDQDLLVT